MKKKLILIDGSGLIFRAFYSLIRNPLRTSKGENTSAIFGFMRMFLKIIRDYRPDGLAVAFDVSRKTFRLDMFPEYKANREKTPDELKSQIPKIMEIVRLMNIPALAYDGYEADDILATLAEKLKNDYDVSVFTGDKDLYQLVENKIKVIAVVKGVSEVKVLDRNGVKAEKGVYPEQIPDFLGIAGDSSDNIPGVRGIGEKGAIALLEKYATLEEIYAHLDEITGANRKKLEESRDIATLSKQLAVLKRDIVVENEPDWTNEVRLENIFNKEMIAKLKEYEAGSVIEEIQKMLTGKPEPAADGELPLENTEKKAKREYSEGLFSDTALFEKESDSSFTALDGKYELVTTVKSLDSILARVRGDKVFSVDFETTSDDPILASIIGIAVSFDERTGYYIPVKHDVGTEFDKTGVVELFRPIFEDEAIKKIGQNLKYEYRILMNYGIILRGIGFDSMIAAYILEPQRTRYNLDDLALTYLHYKTIHYKDIVVDTKNRTLLDVPIEQVRDYAGEDADIALRLRNFFKPLLAKSNVESVYYNIELPLVPVLARMEHTGVLIDTAYLGELSVRLAGWIGELETKIYEIAGERFNINSTQQLGAILFDKLKLPVFKKTAKVGRPSTDEETLEALAPEHPLPAHLVKYRTYTKLKGTYIDTLPELVNPVTGRVHTSFNQTVAQTGRLSSSDPNLQNIPIRDEIGKEIRKAFIAAPGKVLLSADYSQVELRLFAHFSGDDNMRKAFRDGVDIHANTAALVFGVPLAEVTSDHRRVAKMINYGISYGMSAFRLAKELDMSRTDARGFIDRYFDNFPKVREFMRSTLEYASEHGEVRTLLGRMRPVPELKGKKVGDLNTLTHPERFSINTVVQGTAADIMKVAMIRMCGVIQDQFPQVKMILQIHDELVFELPPETVDSFKPVVVDIMGNSVKLDVPLTVDVGVGKNWADAH